MKRLQQLEASLNAYTVNFDASILRPLVEIFESSLRERFSREGYAYLFEGLEQINIKINDEPLNFHVTSYGSALLLWVSNNNVHTYNLLKNFITKLDVMEDIKTLVDFNKHIEVYCGFFVVGKG